MTKPAVSSNFIVDDIHKIREWNYERRKDMTFDEYRKDVATGANRILRQIQETKRNRART